MVMGHRDNFLRRSLVRGVSAGFSWQRTVMGYTDRWLCSGKILRCVFIVSFIISLSSLSCLCPCSCWRILILRPRVYDWFCKLSMALYYTPLGASGTSSEFSVPFQSCIILWAPPGSMRMHLTKLLSFFTKHHYYCHKQLALETWPPLYHYIYIVRCRNFEHLVCPDVNILVLW